MPGAPTPLGGSTGGGGISTGFGLSSSQMEQLLYPYGRGNYSYGSTPVNVNNSGSWQNGAQPGGVSAIGGVPTETGVAANTGDGVNADLGVTPGQTAATGVPAGATASPAGGGALGDASIANAVIGQIAKTGEDYIQRTAQAKELEDTSATPQVPNFNWQPAQMRFTSPPL